MEKYQWLQDALALAKQLPPIPGCYYLCIRNRPYPGTKSPLIKPLIKKKKDSRSPEASILLAGVCGNRTHQGRGYRPTAGFEDQEGHQAPSTPNLSCHTLLYCNYNSYVKLIPNNPVLQFYFSFNTAREDFIMVVAKFFKIRHECFSVKISR